MKTYSRKIGRNRGIKRLWLEGAILLENGFAHGAAWSLTKNEDGSLMISVNPEGNRRVAGTVARPIIDINSKAVLEAFDLVATIQASKSVLVVVPVGSEQ